MCAGTADRQTRGSRFESLYQAHFLHVFYVLFNIQCYDEEMELKTEKIGQLNIIKSSELTRKFQEEKFLRVLGKLQALLFEKNWINII